SMPPALKPSNLAVLNLSQISVCSVSRAQTTGGSMRRILITTLIVLLGWALACVDIWAQATAQISGVVRDQSAAVLPGAEITATQTGTGISRMTVSNETGTYILPSLPLRPYKVEVSLPGFRTFVQTGLVLQVNNDVVINVVLGIAQVSEQVEVEANASLVETRSAVVGQVMVG